jgi:hypothetical protein
MTPNKALPRFGLVVVAVALATTVATAQDPLPSWNDGAAKQAIMEFVAKVTKEGSPDFVPPAERIATFDNDGTLWAEQPMYFQPCVPGRHRSHERLRRRKTPSDRAMVLRTRASSPPAYG